MPRLFTASSVSRISGLPLSTAARRIRRLGITADAELVTLTGLDETTSPLYAESRLREIVNAITPAKQKLGRAEEVVS